MKISNPFRAELSGVSNWINEVLDHIAARINAVWSVEHNDDGTHGDLTVESLTIATSDDAAGAIRSDLVPDENGVYDIGAQSTEPTAPFYAWGQLYLTESIEWIGSAVNLLGQHIPSWRTTFDGTDLSMTSSTTGQRFIVNNGSADFYVGGAATIGPAAVTPAVKVDASLGVTGGLGVTGHAYANTLGLVDGVTAPAAIAGFARIYVDTADGDLKVVFGDGTVKTIATDT